MKCKIKLKKSWSFLEKVKDKETFLFKYFLNFTFFFSQNLNNQQEIYFYVKGENLLNLRVNFYIYFYFHISHLKNNCIR